MNNKQRIIRFSLLLIVLSAVVYFYYRRLPFVEVNPLEAMPYKSSLVLSFNNLGQFKAFARENTFLEDLQDAFFVQKITEDEVWIQQLLDKNAPLWEKNELAASLQSIGNEGLAYVYALDVKNLAPNFIKGNSSTYNFKGNDIHTIKLANNQKITYSYYRNIFVFSTYPLLVEDAVNQLMQYASNLFRDAYFRKVWNENPQNGLEIYLNCTQLPSTFTNYLDNNKKEAFLALQKSVKWIGFGIEKDDKGIAINGKAATPKGNGLLAYLEKTNVKERKQILDVLPDNTASLWWFSTGKFKNFAQHIELNKNTTWSNFFQSWVGEHFAYILTEPHEEAIENESLLYLPIKDSLQARQQLNAFAQTHGQLQAKSYHVFDIKRVMLNDFLKPLLGDQMNTLHNPFYTIIGNYVVFANSSSTLELLMDKYVVGQTLSNETNFLSLDLNLSANPSLYTYANWDYLLPLLKSLAHPNMKDEVENEYDIYSTLGRMSFECSPINGGLTFSGRCRPVQDKKLNISSLAWKTPLAAAVKTTPKVVQNPETKANEIIVQDAQNQLYLFNNGGQLLWKKLLTKPIISEIQQIDYYNTNNLQFIFNTEDAIYLLDHEGNPVAGFPIQLQTKVSNGLTVIDYDGTKKYCIYIACENGSVYGYDRTGKPIVGWNPKTDMGKITHPLLHFQKENMDFLVLLNENGLLSCFKRDGTERFAPVQLSGKVFSRPQLQRSTLSDRIVVANEQGVANIINFQGETFLLPIKPNATSFSSFAFCDLYGDERGDYIVLNKRDLYASYYEGNEFKRLFQGKMPETADKIFPIHLIGNEKAFIGAYTKGKKRAWLINQKGKIYPNFPIAATTPFVVHDLYEDKSNILIVGDEEYVFAYRLK